MSGEVSSARIKNIQYVGILNATPDSFSDGGAYNALDAQIAQAYRLIEDGASVIDVGGDSTRPGSVCVGPEEEWRRVEPMLSALAGKIAVSIDTHHPAVAKKALELGACMVNDISGGSPEMFRIVGSFGAQIVIMYSRCSRPHVFDLPRPPDLVGSIKEFFARQVLVAEQSGLSRTSLLFDPGMGGFLSADPKDSFLLLQQLGRLKEFSPLYLGVSRKGFLTLLTDEPAQERDAISALVTALFIGNLPSDSAVYVRTHNVAVTRAFCGELCVKSTG